MIESTKNIALRQAENEIRLRKLEAESIALDNEELISKNQDYISACNNKARIIVQIAQKKHDKEDVGNLYEQLEMAEKNITDSIIKAGMHPDDLIPQYSCKICNDTGYILDKKCICLKTIYNRFLIKDSNIDFEKFPFIENINKDFYTGECTKKGIELLKQFVVKFDSVKYNNILAVGKSGTGKTYIMKSFAKSVAENNKTILYLTAFNMNKLFMEFTLSDIDKKNQIMNQLLDTDLLLIDDLGTEQIYKNITIELLYSVLDSRMVAGKKTMITTNLNDQDILKRYEVRIYSRLFDKENTLGLSFIEQTDLRLRRN